MTTVEILQVQFMDLVVKVLQVQFIDGVVEILEIMQSTVPRSKRFMMFKRFDKQSQSAAQQSWKQRRHRQLRTKKNPTEKFTRVRRRTLLRACRCDSSQFDACECETSVRRSAKVHRDLNVSPQASQTSSAKTRFTRKSHERQPRKRRQECEKHERESSVAPPRRVDWSISAHTGLRRGVAADHEARSQGQTKDSCKSEGTRRRLHKKDDTYRRIHNRGSLPRANQRDKSHQNT